MDLEGYRFSRDDFSRLLLRRYMPERTDGESAVILAFLAKHLDEFDSITFAKRVGTGIVPNPEHPDAVQRNTVFSSNLKIDILAFRGARPIIIECKQRVTPASLGQIRTYRYFLTKEFPDAPEPELLVVGREATPDALEALQAEGVTVYLYPEAIVARDAQGERV